MKVIREEVAASGRERLVFAMGRTEMQHLKGLLEKAQQYMPRTPETEQACNRNRQMLTTFAKAIGTDAQIWGQRKNAEKTPGSPSCGSWRGNPIEGYSRSELMEIISEMAQTSRDNGEQHKQDLDFLTQ